VRAIADHTPKYEMYTFNAGNLKIGGSKSVFFSVTQRSLQPKYTAEMDEIHGRSGPHVYQLLAVWVHEGGSSHRGHYYAYVYDLEKGSWFLCNDSFVRKVRPRKSKIHQKYFIHPMILILESSEEEIKRTFGGGATYDPLESEKGEAYMLIYRRADVSNTFPMTWDQLPPHTRVRSHPLEC